MISLAIILAALVGLLFYGTKSFDYWKKKGVKHDRPWPFVGNNLKVFLFQKSISQITEDYYWKYPNEKVVGFYRSLTPELIIRDPELIKRVLIQDFLHFHSRGLVPDKKGVEPLLRNLFLAEGDYWKLLRQRMTPTFTSRKLKAMFPLIVERAEKLKARALATVADGVPVDAKDLMARYTVDFMGACGFGLDADTLNDEDSEFLKLGKKIFRIRPRDVFVSVLKELFPETFRNYKVVEHLEVELKSIVGAIMKKRNYESIGRGDFIDLLLECKKQGTVYGDSIEKSHDGVPEVASLEFDDDLIIAQVFVFFAAGYETSSSATSFTLHQLAYHPEIQKKVQAEVDGVLAKHGGKISYEAIKEMTYLEWTFKEAMRLFPTLGFLIRECAKPYHFEDLNLTIDKGVKVLIPVQALHMDPLYFDRPEEFRPERFHPDEFDAFPKYLYLPFGEGPRICIGARLGLMQSIAGLAAILSAFTVVPAPQSVRHPTTDSRSIIAQKIKGGLPLLFKERKAV